MKTKSICKVAFIGAGYMSSEHIKAFDDAPNTELVGICSRTRSRSEVLARDYSIELVCDSIDELYAKTKADLVVIAVPELSVSEVCLLAFKYPWTCLVEKPAGFNMDDAEKILEQAIKLNARAFVALNRRYHSSTRTVVSALDGDPGLRLIHVFDQEDQVAARKAGQPELVVRNWMYANSIHVVDYFTFLGRGNILSVIPLVKWTPENPQFVLAKIIYDSGDIGIYEAVWNGPGPWAVTVTSQQNRWEMRPLEQLLHQSYGSRKLEHIDTHKWDDQFKPGLRMQADEAIKAALGEANSLTTLKDAMKSMRLIQAIYGEGF